MQASPQALVSVVITAYNQADLLRLTINSILEQTYKNIETIVINDGSKDHTAEVLASFGDKIIAVNQENTGANRALLNGLELTKGEYITIIDHDDLMLPTKIEKQMALLENDPSLNVVHCGYYRIDMDGNILEKVTFLPAGDILKDLVSGNFIWSGAPLMRRRLMMDNLDLLMEDVWTGDTDLWLRLATTGNLFGCVQEPLGCRRIVGGSQVSQVAKMEAGSFEVLDKNYSNPNLPDDVKAMKNEAYGNTYFWISCRYYQAEQWDDAQRTFLAAVKLNPSLINPIKNFYSHIQEEALSSVRLIEPVRFVNNVFEHLPAEHRNLEQYQQQTLSLIHMGLALRAFAKDKITEAQQEIKTGIALTQNRAEQSAAFAEMLSFQAVRLPVDDPLKFIDTVFNNLPPEADYLKADQRRAVADVHITQAFLNYSTNQYQDVVQHVLKGVGNGPSWLKNKGVVSILMKSVIASLRSSSN